jgi:hypothetical protein
VNSSPLEATGDHRLSRPFDCEEEIVRLQCVKLLAEKEICRPFTGMIFTPTVGWRYRTTWSTKLTQVKPPRGLPVKVGMPQEVLALMKLYPQPIQRSGIEYLPIDIPRQQRRG